MPKRSDPLIQTLLIHLHKKKISPKLTGAAIRAEYPIVQAIYHNTRQFDNYWDKLRKEFRMSTPYQKPKSGPRHLTCTEISKTGFKLPIFSYEYQDIDADEMFLTIKMLIPGRNVIITGGEDNSVVHVVADLHPHFHTDVYESELKTDLQKTAHRQCVKQFNFAAASLKPYNGRGNAVDKLRCVIKLPYKMQIVQTVDNKTYKSIPCMDFTPLTVVELRECIAINGEEHGNKRLRLEDDCANWKENARRLKSMYAEVVSVFNFLAVKSNPTNDEKSAFYDFQVIKMHIETVLNRVYGLVQQSLTPPLEDAGRVWELLNKADTLLRAWNTSAPLGTNSSGSFSSPPRHGEVNADSIFKTGKRVAFADDSRAWFGSFDGRGGGAFGGNAFGNIGGNAFGPPLGNQGGYFGGNAFDGSSMATQRVDNTQGGNIGGNAFGPQLGNQGGYFGGNAFAPQQAPQQGNQGRNFGGNAYAPNQGGNNGGAFAPNQGGYVGGNAFAHQQAPQQGNQGGNFGGNAYAPNQGGNNGGAFAPNAFAPQQAPQQGNQGGNFGGNAQQGNQGGYVGGNAFAHQQAPQQGNQGGNFGGNAYAPNQGGNNGGAFAQGNQDGSNGGAVEASTEGNQDGSNGGAVEASTEGNQDGSNGGAVEASTEGNQDGSNGGAVEASTEGNQDGSNGGAVEASTEGNQDGSNGGAVEASTDGNQDGIGSTIASRTRASRR